MSKSILSILALSAFGIGALSAQEASWEADVADPGLMKRLNDEAGAGVPTVKHLDPVWLANLAKRGEPTIYRGHDLENIAMPVGGIACGQLYLSGDGRLYLWDIFNQMRPTTWDKYISPFKPISSLAQGFAVRISDGKNIQTRTIDQAGFTDVAFKGQYPIAHIEYHDPACPISVSLDAFSPFIPLNVDDSSLPLTVMRYTLTNPGSGSLSVQLGGWLENQVSCFDGQKFGGTRLDTTVKHGPQVTFVQGSSSAYVATVYAGGPRPDIVFEDFERPTYAPWVAVGTAFGTGPAQGAPNPVQSLRGYQGHGLANSWNGTDEGTGTLTSPVFVVPRAFITFLIAGGNQPGRECINLLVDGKVIHSVTGNDTDVMHAACFEVQALEGQKAQLQIVDASPGGWGHIDVDQIEFTDKMPASDQLVVQPDYGTMGLGLLEPEKGDWAFPEKCEGGELFGTYDRTNAHGANKDHLQETAQSSQDIKLVSGLIRTMNLKPHESRVVSFVVAWSFPHLTDPGAGRYYAKRFPTALTAAEYLAAHYDVLYGLTAKWRDTWYDSTLPYWFLDRTLANISTLATSTTHRFANGDLWGWEGVGSCNGTCTHVWSYEQAMGRLFPELDINLREHTDFNPKFAFKADGQIANRGNHEDAFVDGQAGTILRTYRDYQVSPDDEFLKRNWPKIRQAEEWLIAQDGTGDGLLKTNQRNTLDAEWFGDVAWLSGLYLASLHATEAMANIVGDTSFAAQCHKIATVGETTFDKTLFNGEYYQNRIDSKHLDSVNSGTGCEIDQVLGQSWAFQVGLGRIIPADRTRSALQSLWKYNFTTDYGAYRKVYPDGRVYAVAGESGLLMCTFPKPDWTYANAKGNGPGWTAGYFNECMNGFEHQVAGHMIWEGMVVQGLAIERAVHDRYSATKRNPYNEIECGDHYARSMASYGVFIAACGFSYTGPKGEMGFAPRLGATNFKSAFTAAEGWGSFSQKIDHGVHAELSVKYGNLHLKTLTLAVHGALSPTHATSTLNKVPVPATVHTANGVATVTFDKDVLVGQGQDLIILLK